MDRFVIRNSEQAKPLREEKDGRTICQTFCSTWYYLCHRVGNSTCVRNARERDHAKCPSKIYLLHQSWPGPVSLLLKRFTRP
jgi:hypothetical protein